MDYKKKSFWQTWPGAILGSLVIVGVLCVWVLAPDWQVESQPELEKIRQQLAEGEYFKNEFAYVVSLDSERNLGKKHQRRAAWETTTHGNTKTGYFTMHVVGFRQLSDQRVANDRVVVHFSKHGDAPLKIIRVVGDGGREFAARRK